MNVKAPTKITAPAKHTMNSSVCVGSVPALVGVTAALWAAVTVLTGGAGWEWRSSFLVGGEFPVPVLQGGGSAGAVTIQARGGVGPAFQLFSSKNMMRPCR